MNIDESTPTCKHAGQGIFSSHQNLGWLPSVSFLSGSHASQGPVLTAGSPQHIHTHLWGDKAGDSWVTAGQLLQRWKQEPWHHLLPGGRRGRGSQRPKSCRARGGGQMASQGWRGEQALVWQWGQGEGRSNTEDKNTF